MSKKLIVIIVNLVVILFVAFWLMEEIDDFKGLKEGGYAEDPNYVQNCMNVLNTYKLMPAVLQMLNGVPAYSQFDSKWSEANNYINFSSGMNGGCAITSTAMFCSYYAKQDITPIDIVKPVSMGGYDTNGDDYMDNVLDDGVNGINSKFGLNLNVVHKGDGRGHSDPFWDPDLARQLLSQGKLIIVRQYAHGSDGSYGNTSGGPYHYKLLVGIDGDGFKVHDPAEPARGLTYTDSLQDTSMSGWGYCEMHYCE